MMSEVNENGGAKYPPTIEEWYELRDPDDASQLMNNRSHHR
ncbi:hypothetical protein OAU50_01645 [Planctomycetota bacterium]|nr:hypothetical protein [Planctomycetota bacterium]